MSDIFQIPVDGGPALGDGAFAVFNLNGNPFPAVGLSSGVLYTGHLASELREVNKWIQEIADATASAGDARPIRPLALYGSLGVGKTHLLRTLDAGLSRNPQTPVLRKGLADEGMARLTLSGLFFRYLPFTDAADEPGTGLLRRLVKVAQTPGRGEEMLAVLPAGSPVATPLGSVFRAGANVDAVLWLSRWLRREYTTPSQRAKLGVAGVLQSEGQAVQATADLMRLARSAGLLQVWFVMIDQLEELWRPNVVTPPRRARFLTDLRHLVDAALEGAPIAVLLAWNTTVERTLLANPVAGRFERDYQALWQRMGNPVDLPALSAADVWPFAAKYLEVAGVSEAADERRVRLFEELKGATREVIKSLAAKNHGAVLFSARKVLKAWRESAFQIASRPG